MRLALCRPHTLSWQADSGHPCGPLIPHLPLSSRSSPACGPAVRCWMRWTIAPCSTGCRWKVATLCAPLWFLSPPTERGECAGLGTSSLVSHSVSLLQALQRHAWPRPWVPALRLPSSRHEASGPRPPLPFLPVPTAPWCAGFRLCAQGGNCHSHGLPTRPVGYRWHLATCLWVPPPFLEQSR